MRPRILFIDIETRPLEVYTWQLKNYGYTPVGMIKGDWGIVSVAAKWRGKSKVYQYDLRRNITSKDEIGMLRKISKLLNQADIVIGHNSKKFDIPMITGRLKLYKLPRLQSFAQIDTLTESRKLYRFPSYSLEYLTGILCTKFKKMTHRTYPGMELWFACLRGVCRAWKEMAKYNINDVRATEELFDIMAPDMNLNWTKYRGLDGAICQCGSTEFNENGHHYTPEGKFKRYYCKHCKSELRLGKNLNKSPYRGVK